MMAEFIGINNGREMMFELLRKDISKEQARSVVTNYCLLFDIEVDTFDWDELMNCIYKYYNSWFETFEEMDFYFCELLV